jgi:hypothetical protein
MATKRKSTAKHRPARKKANAKTGKKTPKGKSSKRVFRGTRVRSGAGTGIGISLSNRTRKPLRVVVAVPRGELVTVKKRMV